MTLTYVKPHQPKPPWIGILLDQDTCCVEMCHKELHHSLTQVPPKTPQKFAKSSHGIHWNPPFSQTKIMPFHQRRTKQQPSHRTWQNPPDAAWGTEANSSGWKAPKPFFNVCDGFSLNHSSVKRLEFSILQLIRILPTQIIPWHILVKVTYAMEKKNFNLNITLTLTNVLFVSQNLDSPLLFVDWLIGSESWVLVLFVMRVVGMLL